MTDISDFSFLKQLLEQMEDQNLDPHNMRLKNYPLITNSFSNTAVLDKEYAERLLAICAKDSIENPQFSSSAIIVITNILKRIKEGKSECSAAILLQSALALLNTTKKLMAKPVLRQLCFDALLSFPDETLIALVSSHSDNIMELLYCPSVSFLHNSIPAEVYCFINKLLLILPPEKNLMFVRKGLDFWFGKLIPGVMVACSSDDTEANISDDPELKEGVVTLELLSVNLKQIDYTNNANWQVVLEKICDPKGYPTILKKLLERGCNSWHTLWKIFITLLKDQITKVNISGISPINAMLPVVELAFKLDSKCRCQAFECWDAVINNFSTELNEAMVNKRLKLLMIPLRLNNAKVEETVLAKLNTWWYLIRRFYSKMDKYTDIVLIPFLHFCFGKPDVSKVSGGKHVTPGQMSDFLSLKCIEVLVEIVGHANSCTCCTLPSAGGRLISTKLLVDHWNLWVHCLSTAINTAATKYEESVVKKIMCLWKGFVMIIGELPENQIRADLFIELLKCVESLLDACKTNEKMADLIFYVLIISLITDQRFRPLLKTKNGTGPMHIIVRIIQHSAMGKCYARIENLEKRINQLKPIAAIIMDSSLVDCDELVQYCGQSENRLLLWAALLEVVFECQSIKPSISMVNLIIWPTIKANYLMISKEISGEMWYRWYKLYDHIHKFLDSQYIKEIQNALHVEDCKLINPYFRLCASMATLKQCLLSDQQIREFDAQLLLNALAAANDVDLGKYFPILTDILGLFLNKAARINNRHLYRIAIKMTQIIFKYVNESLKKSCDAQKPIFIDNLQDSSRRFLDKISKTDVFPPLKLEIANTYKLKAEVDHTVASKFNTSKANNKSDSNLNKMSVKKTEASNTREFTTPEPKSDKKTKSNKKELDIVNTVVENGEEFVVVKSHWKFNPKKLTENQKEKLKRKREDIPALYQDLSQSQDEFKLKSWKTDSQDATTSKSESNSKSNDDFAVIFQQLPGTEVVPNIIENNFPDNANKNGEKPTENLDKDNNNKLQKTPTIKGPKTPRLALKDRVFRNVRNLIEKSGTQSDGVVLNQVVEDINQTVNVNALKTPVTKAKTVPNLVNSAPPKISSERPIRSIKKPKKFEDTEVFALKKKRRCHSDDKTPENGKEAKMDSVTITKEDSRNEQQNNTNKETTENQDESQNVEQLQPSEVETVLFTEINRKADKEKNSQAVSAEASQINVNENIQFDLKTDIEKIETEKSPTQNVISQENTTKADDNSSQVIEEISTPRPDKTKKKDGDPSTIKKKRSRIEKQLLIDMVEGHPVLQQSQSEKRITRKNLTVDANDTVSKRRKSLIEKSNKIKAELVNAMTGDEQSTEKTNLSSKSPSPKSQSPKARSRKTQTLTSTSLESNSQTVDLINSQVQSSDSQDDVPMSEDVIESSQDSTLTTISVKSATKKKVPIICMDKENLLYQGSKVTETQTLIDDIQNEVIALSDTLDDTCDQEEKEDIELPKNKTMPEENAEADLTENMDTEPIDSSGEVIVINDDVATPIVINTEDTVVGKETQELAEADTLPMEVESQSIPHTLDKDANDTVSKVTLEAKEPQNDNDTTHVPSQEDITPILSKTSEVITDLIVESSNTGSPLKDEVQRKKDFLNDTIEISPIKTLSPVREKKSPSPETSGDYVVIKLTSPVQSNGEPYNEKCDSPEVFTDDKVSPDKRDQSPPRKQVIATNNSPSSSLSLKKNRPQMRFNGRAAQMVGLCVPEKLQILNIDRSDNDEGRKSSPVSTPAKRNLKRFYNAGGENNENHTNDNDSEESESFLKFTRPLPSAESSPCNPILKRKLAEIADEVTVSPASKRKRVSFHDPPVSTTVAVQKYIEPCGVRSPSNSAIKRQERQFRALTNAKSPKRLENVFRLETVLTKAVESFSDDNNVSNDTEMSLDETPAAEVVKTSELNDTDPICPELLDCTDPIGNIAGELSSPSTKALLIKELVGKVETVADLAKMTELEVNRLCIKAPKVKIAKKVLSKYASERAKSQEITPVASITPIAPIEIPISVPEVDKVDKETQTNEVLTKNSEMQTTEVTKTLAHTQTDSAPTAHCTSQTTESGSKSTKDIISSCLNERPDFVDQLTMQLQQSSIRHISEKLPFNTNLSLLMDKMTASNSTEVLNQVLSRTTNYTKESKGMDLNILQEHLCKRFDSKSLILFCSELLNKIYNS